MRIRRRDAAHRATLSATVRTIGLALTTAGATATQAAASETPAPIDEIIVTATRRSTSVIEVPYNISAYSGDRLINQGVTDISDLARIVPGMSYVDMGPGGSRSAAAVMIIRGLNATPLEGRLAALAQPPVASYLGEAPLNAYLQLHDLERVEVLRGPQGTLFGAGALGGAVRFIPNAPELRTYSGSVDVAVASVAHSNTRDEAGNLVVNVPMGDSVAFRAAVGRRREAGFIDALGLYARGDDRGPLSPVIHVVPGDLASPPLIAPRRDVNESSTSYGRASLRVEPGSGLEIDLAFNWLDFDGDSTQTDNPYWRGGAYVPPTAPAPGIVLPRTRPYQQAFSSLEPAERRTRLGSLDVEKDVGFATLSSNTSYYETDGRTFRDTTGALDFLAGGAFAPYYVGSPRSPAFIMSGSYPDHDHAFTQEVRLVSPGGGRFEWTAGAFYTEQSGDFVWSERAPGMAAWKEFSGSPLPDGFVRDEVEFELTRDSRFSEVAVFGELGVNLTDHWEATFGTRLFEQESEITQNFASNVYPGFHFDEGSTTTETLRKAAFKLDTTYRYVGEHRAYFVFSQGFRRGGANAFATSGPFAEPLELLNYEPDTVNNWELGLKGQFDNGLIYTLAGFYEDIRNIQVDTQTPGNTWPVVVNGGRARSMGIELEVSGNIADSLWFALGYAHADTELRETFEAPTAFCCISGVAGDKLPGAPKHTATATLTYSKSILESANVDLSLTGVYRSDVTSGLGVFGPIVLDEYTLFNASAKLTYRSWSLTAYADNLTDERVEQAIFRESRAGELYQNRHINRPRTIGLRLGYAW